VQYVTADPLADQPTEEDWNGATLLRAYFGGPDIAPDPTTFVPSNGEIKFTNNTGTRVQKVFYEELGAYSFMRAIYPYQGASVVPTVDGGVVVVPVDGSQDVMCSGWGWGSVLATHQPLINTNLAFGHLLTRINVRLVAESAPASGQYGDILGVSLSHQPGELAVNLIDGSVTGWSNNDQNYPLIGQPEVQTLNTAGVDYGYAMALPADSYEIRVETQNRRSFYPVAVLPAVPVGERRAGRVYDVVLSFKAADEIKIAVTDATEWWLDSTFD
jgi:hypothetical protein